MQRQGLPGVNLTTQPSDAHFLSRATPALWDSEGLMHLFPLEPPKKRFPIIWQLKAAASARNVLKQLLRYADGFD